MSAYSKLNVIGRLQRWLDSVPGQTFMNYAYSWGASIVILGALFKLTHLPGANFWLFLGMGTEVFVFFIAGFDRPFDKSEDGKELPDEVDFEAAEQAPAVAGGGTIIIGGGNAPAGPVAAGVAGGNISFDGDAPIVEGGAHVIGGINGPMTPAPAVTQETAEAMEEATTTYVDRLTELNATLEKVALLSKRLTTDSEEMENLNRTLTGIAKVYEMQLKSASLQIGTQDEINEKVRKMAEQMEQLNSIYARMIEAMTVNMPGGAKL